MVEEQKDRPRNEQEDDSPTLKQAVPEIYEGPMPPESSEFFGKNDQYQSGGPLVSFGGPMGVQFKMARSGALIPANFVLREEHKKYSTQERDFTNLLEVVQTPRDHVV